MFVIWTLVFVTLLLPALDVFAGRNIAVTSDNLEMLETHLAVRLTSYFITDLHLLSLPESQRFSILGFGFRSPKVLLSHHDINLIFEGCQVEKQLTDVE